MESLSRRYGVDRDLLRTAVLAFAGVGMIVLVAGVVRVANGSSSTLTAIQLVLLLVLSYVGLLRQSYEAELHSDGTLVFRSVLRTRRTKAVDVRRIGPGRWDRSVVVFEYDGARARLSRRVEHIGDLVFRLRSLNPAVEVEDT